MCLEEHGLSFTAGERFLTRKRDICNRNLALCRQIVSLALCVVANSSSQVVRCLDGNSPCGLMGMLWKKYFGEKVNVEINGLFPHSLNVVTANVNNNELDVSVVREDPCNLLRMKTYDFIFLNCKTGAVNYFDSLFSNVKDNSIITFATSEDPSLYWQSPMVALRNYGGTIVKTSYFRELGIRLVIAEIVRAAARYSKGITVLFSASYKTQQSFTIVVKVVKDSSFASECVKKIKRLLHCSVCEDRTFLPLSEFAFESPSSLLTCDCSKNKEAKTVKELGPVWSGEIFSPEFVESMLSRSKTLPWGVKTRLFLLQILEEARCKGDNPEEPLAKKIKGNDNLKSEELVEASDEAPVFFFNTHKHHPSQKHLQKVTSVVEILRKNGYRASRTHFDPESVRTNATLREFIRILDLN